LEKKEEKLLNKLIDLKLVFRQCNRQTNKLLGSKKRLEIAMVDVAVEKEKTGQLIEIVTRESADAQKEADIAAI